MKVGKNLWSKFPQTPPTGWFWTVFFSMIWAFVTFTVLQCGFLSGYAKGFIVFSGFIFLVLLPWKFLWSGKEES